MKLKNSIVLILSLVFVMISLIACSNATDSPSSDGNGEKKIIEIAGIIEPTISEVNQQRYRWIQSAIDQFEEEHPDFEVRYQTYKGDQIDTTIIRDHEAGISHDVVMVESGRLAAHEKAGSLLDLTPYYSGWSDQDDLNWLSNLDYFNDENNFLAIPVVMHARAIAYRTDLFEEAGLDPNSPPQTLDELTEYAKKLTKDDVYGLGMYMGNHPATAEIYFAPYLWMQGEDILDPETRMASYASEAGAETAQYLSDLVNKHKVTAEFAVTGDYVDSISGGFLNGKFAMVEGFGNYFFANLEASELKDSVGLFLPPLEQRFVNYWGVGIAKSTQYPEEAARLLQLLLDPEKVIMFDYGLPVRQSAYESDEYNTKFYQLMKKSAETGRTFPKTVNYGHLADSIAAAIQEIVLTNGDPLPILKKYQDEYNASYGGE